jgi:hypothetical protein
MKINCSQINISNWTCGDILLGSDGNQYRIVDAERKNNKNSAYLVTIALLDSDEFIKSEFIYAKVEISDSEPVKKNNTIYVAQHKERGKYIITGKFNEINDARHFVDEKVSRIAFRSVDVLEIGSILNKQEVNQACIYENSGSLIF